MILSSDTERIIFYVPLLEMPLINVTKVFELWLPCGQKRAFYLKDDMLADSVGFANSKTWISIHESDAHCTVNVTIKTNICNLNV